jgi:hypothetical protein
MCVRLTKRVDQLRITYNFLLHILMEEIIPNWGYNSSEVSIQIVK